MNEKFCISIRISLKFLPKFPIFSIGSGSGLVPDRRQADPVHLCIYAELGSDELNVLNAWRLWVIFPWQHC